MSRTIEKNPHNDLFSWAFMNKERSQLMIDSKMEGISADLLNCLISNAFAIEALINFVGFSIIDKWVEEEMEWTRFEDKLKKIYRHAEIEFDRNKEPLRRVLKLKDIRNSVAHAKPDHCYDAAETEGWDAIWSGLENDWDKYLNIEFINSSYELIVCFKKELLKAADISAIEEMTTSRSN